MPLSPWPHPHRRFRRPSADAPSDAAPEIPQLPLRRGRLRDMPPRSRAESRSSAIRRRTMRRRAQHGGDSEPRDAAPVALQAPYDWQPSGNVQINDQRGESDRRVAADLRASRSDPGAWPFARRNLRSTVAWCGRSRLNSATMSTNFDEKFTAMAARSTIRAYGVGDQYVESSLDLSNATATASADTSMSPVDDSARPAVWRDDRRRLFGLAGADRGGRTDHAQPLRGFGGDFRRAPFERGALPERDAGAKDRDQRRRHRRR